MVNKIRMQKCYGLHVTATSWISHMVELYVKSVSFGSKVLAKSPLWSNRNKLELLATVTDGKFGTKTPQIISK